jgi:hypothetical protein
MDRAAAGPGTTLKLGKMSVMNKHHLEWQDDLRAGFETCDGEKIGEHIVLGVGEEPVQCPRCKELLKLYWDVRAVAVTREAPFADAPDPT